MRYRIALKANRKLVVPVNHLEALTAAVYTLLSASDAAFAAHVHDVGFTIGLKSHKLFTFAGLRSPNRCLDGDMLMFPDGCVDWHVSTASPEFADHLAWGLMFTGKVQVGEASLEVGEIHTEDIPDFRCGYGRFRCLSPIVAYDKTEDGRDIYLTPQDAGFTDSVRRNLLSKYEALTGAKPTDDRFTLRFDPRYLADHAGTKLMRYRSQNIKGAFAPFVAAGSPELLTLGYTAGFGAKNSIGFGMVQ